MVTSALAGFAVFVGPRFPAAPLSFEEPAWLFAGVAALAVMAALAHRARSGSGTAPRPLVAAFVGVVAAGCAVVAAGPAFRWGAPRLAVVVAVDRSRSVDLVPDASTVIGAALVDAGRGMRATDSLGVVAFAAGAALEEPLHGAAAPRSPQKATLGRDGTDLAAGIRRALVEIPADSAARIVVISDGVPNRGDTMAAAAAATLSGVPVDVLALEQRARPNVRVESLRIPPRAAVGEALDLRVTVRSTVETEADLVVAVDGEKRQAVRVAVHAGEDVLFVRSKAETPGLHDYDVRLVPMDPAIDSVAEDDSQTAFVRVSGRARAVVIDEDAGHAAPIRSALEAAAFDVEVANPRRAPPADVQELLRNDLVVMGNVPRARSLTGAARPGRVLRRAPGRRAPAPRRQERHGPGRLRRDADRAREPSLVRAQERATPGTPRGDSSPSTTRAPCRRSSARTPSSSSRTKLRSVPPSSSARSIVSASCTSTPRRPGRFPSLP